VEGLVHAAADHLALDAFVALFELRLHLGREVAVGRREAVALLAENVLPQKLGIPGERVGEVGGRRLIADGKAPESG